MKIAISGYYGFGNLGDEAVLEAIKSKLDCRVVTRSLSGLKTLIKSDLFISGGGTLFQNKTSNRSFYYYIGLVLVAKILRKKVVVLAQGFGPLSGSLNRLLAKAILDKVDLITARDNQSLEEIRRLGIKKPHIKLTADPVFCLQCKTQDEKALLGIVVRKIKHKGNYRILAKAIDWLAEQNNLKPVFFPFHHPEDTQASQKVAEQMRTNYEIATITSPTEMLKTIASLKLLIGMRLHSLVFATIGQTPMLGLSYDPKVTGFMTTIDQPSLAIDQPLNLKTLKNTLENIINSKKEIQKELEHKAKQLQIQANENFRILESLCLGGKKKLVAKTRRHEEINFSGIIVDNLTIQEAVNKADEFIKESEPHLIVTPNPEIIVTCQKDKELKEIFNSANLRVADGISMVVVSKILKKPLKERVSGIDLMLKIAENKERKVFLLGGAPGVAEAAAKKLKANVIGTQDGYFKNDQEVIDKIKVMKPEVLFVGLGAGRQERWANHHLEELGVPVVMTIGGSLDVISGKKRRAPKIFQKLYIEWLYRLITEPKRWKRQLALPKFLWLMLLKRS